VQCCRLVHLTGDVLLMLLMSVPYNPFGGNSWLRVVDADAGTVLHCTVPVQCSTWSPRPWQRGTTLVHRHNARLPGSGQSAVGGTGAGLSDRRATCVTAESWCGRAAGIDGPTWVMATYKIADCTRYIPYPIVLQCHCRGCVLAGVHSHLR
jgi:hypothetical protein